MKRTLALLKIEDYKLKFSIFVLILFHAAALIGVSIGFKEWFVSKTPLNLLISSLLLIWNYPLDSLKKWLLGLIFFLTGMTVEWIGVHSGWLFGNYSYGGNMGPLFDGVPYFIGVYWAVLVFITGSISSRISQNLFAKILLGSTLMVLLDYFMEKVAPVFDFWTFEGGIAPLENYITWFAVAAVLHFIFQKVKTEGNFKFSLALYMIQLFFFMYFYFYLYV